MSALPTRVASFAPTALPALLLFFAVGLHGSGARGQAPLPSPDFELDTELDGGSPEVAPEQLDLPHWAFRPIAATEPPPVLDEAWVENPVDAFVLAGLESRGLAPSPEAPPHTLIRRLHLDLVGLLPDPARDPQATLTDEAYEALVDELLASPHFAERWARHWLDVARYADSDGYTNDEPREIWPYRDYVIEAFDRDLPFDRFIVEQLAGDLLPDPSVRELVATAFHRNTMRNTEGGIDVEEFRVEAVKNRVDTTAKAFLGLTMECAQCHNHLYDPLTQAEYYQLYAFFNDAEETTLPLGPKYGRVELPVFAPLSQPRESFVQVRGNFLDPGEPVGPGVPAVLPPLPATTGRASRLDLANWLVAPEHPLTARVLVNRTWQHLFGLGLVKSEDDFGTRGEAPVQGPLLDWLARTFQEGGWSQKGLIRTIVTSATYRQASDARDDIDDPDNRLLARQERLRLEAEILRDVTLGAAGLLDLELGGPSVFPPIPEGVIDAGRGSQRWPTSTGGDRYRRGLYTFTYRSVLYPSLAAFDAPDGVASVTRRARSNTALQPLTLLNDIAFVEAALAFGTDLLEHTELDDAARLESAFRRTLFRPPTEAERRLLLDLLQSERRSSRGQGALAPWQEQVREAEPPPELAAWTMLARVLLNLDEFITRQ